MTIQWTDNPATTSTHVRTVHINELRGIVNMYRTQCNLPAYSWTDDPVATTTRIRAVHFTELRSAIQDLWNCKSLGSLPNWSVGTAPSSSRHVSARDINDLRNWVNRFDPSESIIGAQWTNNGGRNWAGKLGWDIQLVYATNPPSGFDYNTVGNNVQSSHQAGRNVLVRVDYAPPDSNGNSQSVPPNDAARTTYMQFLQQICSDARFNQNAWGYIIGNEYNLAKENGGGTPVTPSWYARVFNGYSASGSDTGNAYQVIKTYQPPTYVLVGAVGPWSSDANSDDGSTYSINMPWLNYFNEVCRLVYSMVPSKGPVDGFAIHAYGRTGTNGTANGGAQEPHTDVQGQGWATGAWAGFTVYKNWRDIINQFSQSVPIWVTETNTNTDAHSSSSYPSGWYLQALSEIASNGARFQALCWFPDQDYGGGWPNDCLTNPVESCVQANSDFNYALTSTGY